MQLQCCGVDSSDDFKSAVEFIKYTNEANAGQVVPEVRGRLYKLFSLLFGGRFKTHFLCKACCKLEGQTALFKPVDEDCIYSPSTTNSYMNRVSIT